MERFQLQPHHLPANAILTLSAYITFCEAYLGLWPSINLWAKYFQFQPQVIPDRDTPAGQKLLTQCGAATVVPRLGSIFPRIQGLESHNKWLRSFFYIKNSSNFNRINLPKFMMGPPTKVNWNYDPKDLDKEVNLIHKAVFQLRKDGLSAEDLLATFIGRRVSPLQHRPHKMCHMSGRHDPCRITTVELSRPQIYRRIKAVAKTRVAESDWVWGKEPYDRANPAPLVSSNILCPALLLCRRTTLSDITSLVISFP
jgi:hypothetical protein